MCSSWRLKCAQSPSLVAYDCGYPLLRYTCRATRVAADFLDYIAFCRCSTGVAVHPLKILVSHLPPPFPGGVAPKFGSDGVSRHTGVSQLQLRVSRYTVQLSLQEAHMCSKRRGNSSLHAGVEGVALLRLHWPEPRRPLRARSWKRQWILVLPRQCSIATSSIRSTRSHPSPPQGLLTRA